MTKFCTNCGNQLTGAPKFCPSCGHKVAQEVIDEAPKLHKRKSQSMKDIVEKPQPPKTVREETKREQKPVQPPKKSVRKQGFPKADKQTIQELNHKIRNTQNPIARNAWILAGLFLVVLLLGAMEIVALHPAVTFLSLFLLIVAVVVGFMFRGRGKKLDKLITGKNLLASWKLSDKQKEAYVNQFFENKKTKNKALFSIMTILFVVIFGGFILFIEESEGRILMALMGAGILAFLSIFAFGAPYYYRASNKRKDGYVLIGAKYAYINGYFHNWDYPLSGLQKLEVIQEPFRGLRLTYYYTDRTLRNIESLEIPVNEEVDLEALIRKIQEANG